MVVLNFSPVNVSVIEPSVLFAIGSNGINSVCSTFSNDSKSTWESIKLSKASLGGSKKILNNKNKLLCCEIIFI